MALKNKDLVISVIGARGVVGRELLSILETSSLSIKKILLFGSERSEGEIIDFKDESHIIKKLTSPHQIEGDIAFFCAGSAVSEQYIERVSEAGTICIDKSSFFRMSDKALLIVPEINGDLLKEQDINIIASPNCVVIPLVQVLAAINKISPIEHIHVVTFQAVSGAGQAGHDELEEQIRNLFNMREVKTKVFQKRIAFNVLPFIPAHSPLDQLGKTEEEIKVIEETKRILDRKDLAMEVTCVRVPVFNGHSMSVHIATKESIFVPLVKDTLSRSPGLMLIDESSTMKYPTPNDASGEDLTLVGRVRTNTAVPHGLSLWISSDNLRTGAALNAVRIAETLVKE